MDNLGQLRGHSLTQNVEDVSLEEAQPNIATSLRAGGVAGLERVVNSRLVPKPEARLISLDFKHTAAAEFRVLAARLSKLKTQHQVRRVLVAGCNTGSGGSLVSANLALALAQNPANKVLLIEGNLEHPSMDARFGIQAREGLSEYLQGSYPIENVVHYLTPGGIWFLSAGTPPRTQEQRIQILRSPKLPFLFRQEANWFDWIIVDSPPLEAWGTAGALAQLCDGLLVVVRQGHTRKSVLRRALDTLDRVPVLGYAFNELEP
jgi:Mrp family chromosome partitioning ATPase